MGGTVTGVDVLDKDVAIPDVVERAPAGASELARENGLLVSTAHRLANALVVHGLLRRDPDGRFRLGPGSPPRCSPRWPCRCWPTSGTA